MNRLLLLAFMVALLALVASASEQQDENMVARVAREAAGPKKGKGRGKGRKNGKGNKARAGRRSSKKGKKNKNSRPNKKPRVHKVKSGGCRSTTSINSTCIDNAMTYLKVMKDNVNNFFKQEARIKRANKTGGGKSGKKGLFAPTLRRIVKAGGGNKSDLQCNGVSNSSGANQLTNLTQTLLKCEKTINASCNPSNFPHPNTTMVTQCKTDMTAYKGMVDTCLAKSGEEACNCWLNSTFETAVTKVRACKISDSSKAMISQLNLCKGNFSLCKTYEDEGLKAISACSESTDSLKAKAKALTQNSAGLTAAKTTASNLANSTSRRTRAAVTTCAAVVSTITKLLSLVDQNPASSRISVLAATVTSVTVTCTTTEKASLTSQVTSLDTAITTVSSELATVQADLETATGTTASDSAIASATVTESSSSKRNIMARHLMNRFNN